MAQPAMEPDTAVLGTSFTREEPSTLGFPIGWYTGLGLRADLPAVAGDGMGAVMPYHSLLSHVAPYLDAAAALGVKVLIEIPRPIVKEVDTTAITTFVNAHKAHPALLGWYLADEPTTTTSLGPLAPADAVTAYATVKEADPSHPVAIAFNTVEPAELFQPAMDVMMLGYYPFDYGSPEFVRLPNWTTRMSEAAAAARTEDDFIPIIQAYGGTETEPAFGRRYPTPAEQRYMVYASLQLGATGLFFWAHYRADPQWVDQVLEPIVTELNVMRPALAQGERSRLVGSRHADVRATAFRHPKTGATYVVAVHHGEGTVRSALTLRRGLRLKKTAVLMGENRRRVNIKDGRIRQSLGPFGVKVYRLR